MSRLILILILLVLIVIAIDPVARQKAAAFVDTWDDRIVVRTPSESVFDADDPSTPVPTSTPIPDDDADKIIPDTGADDASDKPIIQVNWDALGDALRKFWDSLRNVEIDVNPQDNK